MSLAALEKTPSIIPPGHIQVRAGLEMFSLAREQILARMSVICSLLKRAVSRLTSFGTFQVKTHTHIWHVGVYVGFRAEVGGPAVIHFQHW